VFGINGGELVVLLVLAFLLIGPERLPELAQQLGRLTREVKKMATGAKEKVREELGPEFDDLAALDPRQYDPRRIVREALMEDDEPPRPARPRAARRPSAAAAAKAAGVAAAGAAAGAASANGSPAPSAGAAAAGNGAAAAPASGAPAARSAVAGRAAVVPPSQVLAQARGAVPAAAASAATAVAEQPRDAGRPGQAEPVAADEQTPAAPDEPYVVPFDDEAT